MSEFKNDRDYSIIAFFNDRNPIKYTYCTDIDKECRKLASFGDVHHFNIYARRSGRFLQQFKPGQYIPKRLN